MKLVFINFGLKLVDLITKADLSDLKLITKPI